MYCCLLNSFVLLVGIVYHSGA